MRQLFKVVVGVLVIIALLFTTFGCTGTAPEAPTTAPAAPTPAPAAPTAAAPAQPTTAPAAAPTAGAAASEVIELKYHHHDSPASIQHSDAHLAWAKSIEERTNGKVKITVYGGETLGKATTAIDMAVNGVADIAWGYISIFPGRFPFTDMLALPMLGATSGRQASKVMWEASQTIPEIAKEWDQTHLILLHAGSPQLFGFKKKVSSLEELKGVRLRVMAGAPLKFAQALGATPVTVTISEVFEAMQKGTIDAYCCDWAGIGAFKLDDVSKYVLEESLYVNGAFMVMNKKKWDSLPPDIQKVFNEVGGAAGAELFGSVWDKAGAKFRDDALKKGIETYKLTPEERARWDAKAPVVWDEYIKIADEKGANGQALFDKIKSIYANTK